MSDRDRVEYYNGNRPQPFLIMKSSIVPPKGSFINIQKQVWKVVHVSYQIDYAGQPHEYTRASVNLKKVKE